MPKQETKHFEFPSSSSDAVYKTILWDDGTFSCDCPAWRFKKAHESERTCKHIKSISSDPKPAEPPAPKIQSGDDFFKPMLAHDVTHVFGKQFDESALKKIPDVWVAEPKYDGKRALVFVDGSRTRQVYSRLGNSTLGNNGELWMKDVKWPVSKAIFDCELAAGIGLSRAGESSADGKSSAGLNKSLIVFDLLEIGGDSLMKCEWEIRRHGLEKTFEGFKHDMIAVSLTSTEPYNLMKKWGEMGGEGVMLKHRDSKYYPGRRSDQWLKVKFKYDVDVVVTGHTTKPTYGSGAYKSADAAITYGYWSPDKKEFVTVGQGGILGTVEELKKHVGKVLQFTTNGVMPGGALCNPRLPKWRPDKDAKECLMP